MVSRLVNENPIVYERNERRVCTDKLSLEPIDTLKIFDILSIFHVRCFIKYIRDPELPSSLEHLKVLTKDSVKVDDDNSHVRVTFTPTMKICGMTSLIGLCLRVKLIRSLPARYKVDIRVAPGTHATEAAATWVSGST
ncbi:unnamed protein product [Eruca vesicaria subsp. sativa]|uniref:MIP18 family-like domain-containing protein n=1 Tax=Eruca vesicaria subsp. sativa TaxID=29727 RepID=A0ABC8LS32_ERUVS|nr:unnamed protein product [Eruca vesicaria subsp. sativa]